MDAFAGIGHKDYNPKDRPGLSPHDYDPILERQAVGRLDFTLLPVLIIFYVSFLYRANFANARVAGLQKDLGLTDTQYQICVTVLFLPYIASQLPANLILRRLGPAIFMPSLLTLLGIVATFQGKVRCSCIPRSRRGSDISWKCPVSFFVLHPKGVVTSAGTFLPLVGFLIHSQAYWLPLFNSWMELADAGPGWAWIFILEGLFTICMGLVGFFLVPSTPRDSRFLTEEQKDIIMARLERDRRTFKTSDTFTLRKGFRSLSSPHVIILFIMKFMVWTMLIGLALFLPSSIKQLGYSRNKTQPLSAGPLAAAPFVTLITAFCSDYYNSWGIPLVITSSLTISGYALFLGVKNNGMAYGALYLLVPGVRATVPILSRWMANNSEPYCLRAAGIGLAFVSTAAGGLLSTWSHPTKNGPKFRKTMIMNITFASIVLVGSLLNMPYLSRRNKQKHDAGYRAEVLAKFNDDSDGELKAWMELGDRHPDFRYAL